MERVPALRYIIEPNDWICKIDLKNAYVVVPIHKDSKKYLAFRNKGTVYHYNSLTFGLSVAPRLFSKLMRFALEPLRAKGVRLVYYLDDVCSLAQIKEEMNHHTEIVLKQLTTLGFLINHQKSDLTPRHIQDFLGFTFDSKQMKITVPQKKLIKLTSRIKQLFKKDNVFYSCRWIAALLGKITAMIPAMGEALLRIRFIQRDLAWNLRLQRFNWEAPCKISADSWKELQW
jgi:hypothetical protein